MGTLGSRLNSTARWCGVAGARTLVNTSRGLKRVGRVGIISILLLTLCASAHAGDSPKVTELQGCPIISSKSLGRWFIVDPRGEHHDFYSQTPFPFKGGTYTKCMWDIKQTSSRVLDPTGLLSLTVFCGPDRVLKWAESNDKIGLDKRTPKVTIGDAHPYMYSAQAGALLLFGRTHSAYMQLIWTPYSGSDRSRLINLFRYVSRYKCR